MCPDVSPRPVPGRGCLALGGGHGAAGSSPSVGRTIGGGDRRGGGREGRCDGSVWFTSLARPSLSPSPAARGGAAVREGPAGRQLPPAPRGGGLRDKAAGRRPSRQWLFPPPPASESGEQFVYFGPCRACPALVVLPAPPLRDAAQPRGQHPFPLPLAVLPGALSAPQPRSVTEGEAVAIASPPANKSSAMSAAPTSRPADKEQSAAAASLRPPVRRAVPTARQPGDGRAGLLPRRREARRTRGSGQRRERGRRAGTAQGGSASRSHTKRRGGRGGRASQTGSRKTSLTSCCFPDVTRKAQPYFSSFSHRSTGLRLLNTHLIGCSHTTILCLDLDLLLVQ